LLWDDRRLWAISWSATFNNDVPERAYRVKLPGNEDDLEWIEQTPSGEKRDTSEPGASILRRAWIDFLSVLPIE
jgi:putative cardiolipin synthase